MDGIRKIQREFPGHKIRKEVLNNFTGHINAKSRRRRRATYPISLYKWMAEQGRLAKWQKVLRSTRDRSLVGAMLSHILK